jgi:tetratricopeptide (TPR) repeat protein
MAENTTREDLFAALYQWLGIKHPGVSRHFLETHPELLGPQAFFLIRRMFADVNDPSGAIWQLFESDDEDDAEEAQEGREMFRERVVLLYDIHTRGGTQLAIREAYIDVYGGIALDLPSWLENAFIQLQMMAAAGLSEQMMPFMSDELRRIIMRAERASDVPPEMFAELRFFLQEILKDSPDAQSAAVQEERIAILHDILHVYTRERFPRRYAEIQHNLGLLYKQRVTSDERDNLQQAIDHFQRAIDVFPPDIYPENRAMNLYNLGNVLMMVHINRADKENQIYLHKALDCFQEALQYYTRSTHPYEYAKIQQSLAGIYADYMEGERFAHVDKALEHLQQALTVFTLDKYPLNYAEAHRMLAILYKERVEYARMEDIEKGLLSCQNALRVYTRERFPREYASMQNVMGALNMRHVMDKRGASIEEAIACHQRALQVFTLDDDPQEYAETLNLLGNVFRERLAGNRAENQAAAIDYYRRALETFQVVGNAKGTAKIHHNLALLYSDWLRGNRAENQEVALAHALHALEFFTRESYPEDYAGIQMNLGTIYKQRVYGDLRANLEDAMRCYQLALQIYTPTRFPTEYAQVQHNLGNAYIDRIAGTKRDNIEEALDCYQRAIQIFTRDHFPLQYAITHIQLGTAYRERIAGERRANQEEALACFERALHVLTLEGTPIEYAKAHHNLANVYKDRVAGSQQDNQEQAIFHYTEALKVNTLQDFPDGYAMAQDSLGVIYSHRIAGERRANLEQAITCHQQALQVFTREAFPLEYAGCMNNLGMTYMQRLEGNPGTNLKEAIRCFQAALEVFTPQTSPLDHANTLANLGAAYMMSSAGERRYNLERAIDYFEDALRFITAESLPLIYASIQNNLGAAYQERIAGERWENVERAIGCHEAALQVFTLEKAPLEYAKTQNNLGTAYMERRLGNRRENVEQALACFNAALAAYATDPTLPEVASTFVNLGVTYVNRQQGDHRANLEEALSCFRQALRLYERDPLTFDYARLQLDMGNVYARRLEGDEHTNQEEALAYFERALRVFTLENFPRQHRDTRLNIALVQANRQNWLEAHVAYQGAVNAEDLLVTLGAGVVGRDAILREGRDPALNDGFALTQLGRFGEAAISLEHGRARGLAEAMALDDARPDLIGDPILRASYEQARSDLINMQNIINISSSRHFDVDRIFGIPGLRGEHGKRRLDVIFIEEYQKQLDRFQLVFRELREADELLGLLDVRVDQAMLLQVAEQCGQRHAVVYLAATTWGSMAVAAPSSNPARNTSARFASLNLPELSESLVDDLLETRLLVEKLPVSNSYGAAQSGIGFDWFLSNWSGETFRDRAMSLHAACEREEESSTFDFAAQKMLQTDWLAELVDAPLTDMQPPAYNKLARAMEHYLLHYELERCLEILAQVALRPLTRWLQQEGVTGCTLIPCGPLAAFPLLAAEIVPGQTMADLLTASVALNARSLSGESRPRNEQSTVYALGDPRPSRQELAWAEAEALTVAKLARKHGLGAQVKVRKKATLDELTQALEKGYIVDTSCHGRFDLVSPLDSALILANRRELPLYELLSHRVDMRGLRLLILSACQTDILDLRSYSNEVRSLAAGMVQAGARAVLAALWSVDDMATYLLIVRFMQEWLPHMAQEGPAAVLARAQRWLRTVTVRELQQWHASAVPLSTEEERRESGSQSLAHAPEAQDFLPYFTDLSIAPRRNSRYDISQAEWEIHVKATHFVDPDICPYADPIYWAGFRLTGW